jgi:hypothetical protein
MRRSELAKAIAELEAERRDAITAHRAVLAGIDLAINKLRERELDGQRAKGPRPAATKASA